ncbi:MAG: ABC transporter substrate-binding protein [Pseudorhodoplanes sp.]|nr:MAG: ABC transporter substrate-binding protein [Pseudorhodoplanes sp.]
MRLMKGLIGALALATPLALAAIPASAQDALKLAIGQRGNWETAVSEIGQRAGIFKKHGLDLELLYTAGAGETLQAVISGAADIGIGVGTSGALSAFSKGAPVRAIGSATVGSNDLYWYVKADSPIKGWKDTTETTRIAYSTTGSSTNMLVLGFIKEFSLKAKAEKTGSPPATLTAVMSGQVEVGWAAPPFGLKQVEEGQIRIIGRGSDVPSTRNQTVRLLIANANRLAKDKAVIQRYMDAYRETLDFMYSDAKALALYKDFAGIPENLTRKAMTDFYPKTALDPDRIEGIDSVMADAVTMKFIPAPLSKAQLADFFQVPPRKK